VPPPDRVVLVTGAARGIGAATARAFADRGARVALVGLEPDRLQEVAAACGPAATWHEADVADNAALTAAVEAVLAAHGRIDVVFANAGIGIGGPVHRLDPAQVARLVEVNLLGAFHTAHATAGALIASRGYLLLNASISAVAAVPGLGPYAATKAGVAALGDVVREELRHHGVGVGVVYFGWVDTDLVKQAPARMRVGTIPVEQAAAAVVRGVEGRRGTIVEPRRLAPALPLAGVLRPLLGRVSRRYAPALERAWDRETGTPGSRVANDASPATMTSRPSSKRDSLSPASSSPRIARMSGKRSGGREAR
jgi:NAD(P)-dependent dehydrogenase (short-subunit alcohol dehydrogenase family)